MNEVRVFISHRRSDSKRAEEWAAYLTEQSIECYLDTLDPTPSQLRGREVSKYLHDQLKKCSHLLVIFTPNTLGSMWVPFEIGIATERDTGIAIDLYANSIALPEYLQDWPILITKPHFAAFAELVKEANYVKGIYKSLNMRYSDQFHEKLRSRVQ